MSEGHIESKIHRMPQAYIENPEGIYIDRSFASSLSIDVRLAPLDV